MNIEMLLLHRLFRSRGGTEEKPTKHAKRLFKMIDIDQNGNLTETEFLRVRINFVKNTTN